MGQEWGMATWVITGANRGIGLSLCRQVRRRGDEVIGVCRAASGELRALGVRPIEGIDVSDDGAAAKLREALADTTVDVLVNNAGLLFNETLADLDFERVRRQLEVNAIGPLRVTSAVVPRMTRGGKIAIITSRMGSIADNTSGSYYGYRMSKAAVNAAGKSLAGDLKGRGIAVALLHPGMVATEMTGGHGIDPEESAAGLLARIDALTLESSGTFWHMNGEVLPW
jgi:NAD(P)-dependent dehydrogenase (short-subunit alcohol dehydrogenase family)